MTNCKRGNLVSGHLCEDSEKVYCITDGVWKIRQKKKLTLVTWKKKNLYFVYLGLI